MSRDTTIQKGLQNNYLEMVEPAGIGRAGESPAPYTLQGVIFDKSVSYRMVEHLHALTGITVYTRNDIVNRKQDTAWKVPDIKYVKFAKANNLLLFTSDKNQSKQAKELGVPVIFYPQRSGLPAQHWDLILKVMQKLKHPYFDLWQKGLIDLRVIWKDYRSKWLHPSINNPNPCGSKSRYKQLGDSRYECI